MANSAENLRKQIGKEPTASFEVARGTDTEWVDATPEQVFYSMMARGVEVVGPCVIFRYSKYNAFLPPWNDLVSFELDGDVTATFVQPEHIETNITGSLKTVHIGAMGVQIR